MENFRPTNILKSRDKKIMEIKCTMNYNNQNVNTKQ